MKTMCTLLFVLLFSSLSAQSSVRLSIIAGADWNKSNYTFPGGFTNESLGEELPLGHTLGARLRVDLGNQFAFSTGLNYSKKVFHPELMLGGVYGTLLVDPEDESSVLFNPYLEKHDFGLLQLPLHLQYQFSKNGSNLRPYLMIGFTGQFRLNERETYRDTFVDADATEGLSLAIDESEFGFFGLYFDLGLGFNIKITERLGLLFEHQASLWEYRSGNEKFKKNGELLFENSILSLSRLSLIMGLDYAF